MDYCITKAESGSVYVCIAAWDGDLLASLPSFYCKNAESIA